MRLSSNTVFRTVYLFHGWHLSGWLSRWISKVVHMNFCYGCCALWYCPRSTFALPHLFLTLKVFLSVLYKGKEREVRGCHKKEDLTFLRMKIWRHLFFTFNFPQLHLLQVYLFPPPPPLSNIHALWTRYRKCNGNFKMLSPFIKFSIFFRIVTITKAVLWQGCRRLSETVLREFFLVCGEKQGKVTTGNSS